MTGTRWDYNMAESSPTTSFSLLERLHDRRDALAWGKLVTVYTPLLRAWLRTAGLQPADCDDLTQQVLQVLNRKVAEFKHNGHAGAFRAWLHGITRNVLRDFYRSRPAPAAASSILDQLAHPGSDLSRQWDDEYNHHVIRGLLELVQPDFNASTMQAFRRVVLDEVPPATVAQELGLSVNAVLIAKSRVLARLRREGQGLTD
jgi:RNA polymerase sigma-70 factor (ECF subfamily)